MKQIIRKMLAKYGFEIRQIQTVVGRMDVSLKHLRACGLRCNNILDVGANQGKWSRLAQQVFPESNLYLVEPQLEMEPYLDEFCKNHKQAKFFLTAVGAEQGEKTLTVWDDLQGSSFLPGQDMKLRTEGKQREITMTTIDQLIEDKQIEIPDLIKLDIQGYELEALKGAEKTFGTTEAYILEVSLFPFEGLPGLPVFEDVVNFMAERNYVVYDFAGFLRRPLDKALGQCDICFVKRDGLLRKSSKWK